jgi:hypothetical protein
MFLRQRGDAAKHPRGNSMLRYAGSRQQAERCRKLLRAATAPEIREQLMVWVREFEEEAGAGNLEPMLLNRVLADSPS